MIAADDAGKHVSKTLQNKYEKLEDAPAEKVSVTDLPRIQEEEQA